MKKQTVKGNPQERKPFENESIFNALTQIADAVVNTFSRNFEVVVHDLTQPQKSIKHIAGDVTRRKLGGPITDLVVKALHQEGRNIRDRYNYKTTTNDGRVLKSTTVFIRNKQGEVIAAFCINFDMTDYINATYAMEMFTSTATSFNGQEKVETFAVSITETIEALLEQAVSRVGKQTSSMSKEEKIELVKDLEASGVFQIKGAVDHVALLIGVSKYTIYNYLRKIRTEQDFNRF